MELNKVFPYISWAANRAALKYPNDLEQQRREIVKAADYCINQMPSQDEKAALEWATEIRKYASLVQPKSHYRVIAINYKTTGTKRLYMFHVVTETGLTSLWDQSRAKTLGMVKDRGSDGDIAYIESWQQDLSVTIGNAMAEFGYQGTFSITIVKGGLYAGNGDTAHNIPEKQLY